ncbi:hypothetical protein ABOM_005017 [Aspergillus bombycis]|uniref:Amidase domain-containing protein n=1 Tax=Aspergillus bombycis TaxID=109264 RepID=A0A1F8A632_9EURO|nr:hypothetical protein ABOM_005017 [Aspergillus bombycis]OGM46849.1 hypothetical protein ABOM_005017 [Aspergillus bombycis]
MQLETNSTVYGRTTNPYNREYTSGGSSGGEGALIGMRGSVFGIGGDIGGSICVPVALNGIYGFKLTTNRFPGVESRAPMAGSDTIHGVNGPLAADREALELLMKVVLDAKPWRKDPLVIPQPWTHYTFGHPLKIGIQMSDEMATPHPPVLRALRGLFFPDGGEDVMNVLAEVQEPVLPLTNCITKEQPNVRSRDLSELWEICCQRDKCRAEYARHWANTGSEDGREADVVLGPAYPGAAPPHECTCCWPYTSTWNLLDYPAAVFPVTVVSPEDGKDMSYVPGYRSNCPVDTTLEPDVLQPWSNRLHMACQP